MATQPITNSKQFNENFQEFRESFILKVMEDEFGQTAAHAIISHISHTTMKSKSEILSDFETFSKFLKLVYTEEVAEREILTRLQNLGIREQSN